MRATPLPPIKAAVFIVPPMFSAAFLAMVAMMPKLVNVLFWVWLLGMLATTIRLSIEAKRLGLPLHAFLVWVISAATGVVTYYCGMVLAFSGG